jgi:hypothetical protein
MLLLVNVDAESLASREKQVLTQVKGQSAGRQASRWTATILLVGGLGLAACEAREAAAPAPEAVSERTTLAMDGFGPLKVGMSRAEAERALGAPLTASPPAPGSDCQYARPPQGPDGLSLMLIAGTVARIDVRDNAALATPAGIHIGSNEFEVDNAYRGRIAVAEQKYQDGHDLTVTDPARPDLRYVFETDGTRVTRFRAGRVPEVEFVEGCG